MLESISIESSRSFILNSVLNFFSSCVTILVDMKGDNTLMSETTAQRLKTIMNQRNLKQVDILQLAKPYCEKHNVTLGKSDLSQFVNGKVTPGQQKLTILGLALNVSEAWLMGLDVPAQREMTVCPVCGLLYAADFEPDAIEHNQYHNKFLLARNRFGICYSPLEFDRIKEDAYKIIHSSLYSSEKTYTIKDQIDATIKLLATYFSRSVWSNNYNLMHPTFAEYIPMLLNQNHWKNSIDKDIYNTLVYQYGTSPGLTEGKTIYEVNSKDVKNDIDFLKDDELSLINDYRSLSEQGQEYIRQTMYMAKQTYNLF